MYPTSRCPTLTSRSAALLPRVRQPDPLPRDRTRCIAGEYRKALTSKYGMVPAAFLTGGFVRGTWKTGRSRGRATLEIKPFEPLAKEHRATLAEEGERLLRFTGAEDFEIRFA